MDERRKVVRRERQMHLRMAKLARQSRRDDKIARNRAAELAIVSHEMREPLNGIIGLSRLLRETKLDEEQTGYVEGVQTSARTLLELVNDLLDASRIDAGALELLDVTFRPSHLTHDIVAMLQPRAAMRGVTFEIILAPDMPPFLRADPGRLRQIILNLATNALKFTPEGSVRVLIGLVGAKDDVATLQIDVVDTGIGVDAAARERLGGAFQQGDASIGQLYGGSGLGLMITRRLLHAMGGDLSWEPRVEGGMHFRATCQVAVLSAAANHGSSATLEGLSLLVVDRQEDSRLAISGLAKLWGMRVRGARSGREAITILHEASDRGRPIDLLLTESPLSDMSIEEFVSRLGDAPHLASTRLILQTAAGMRGDAAWAKEMGFAAYLPKPVASDILRACLQQAAAVDEPAQPLITVHGLAESRRSLSILVVDDNPVNRRLASILLERAGHRVAIAEDGAGALAAVERTTFDAILMDVQMPGMDGLEASRLIRRLESPLARSVPIVALTANATSDSGRQCREAGMDDYVTKPIDGARLVAILERLVRQRQRAA
ncbi:Signal transduction histidine kinase [Arboricoccus pini]|uniref:histidine kinase n=1 Tax=Arboricoccus pini TaxID=1963835 RepID=A0A212RC32_9PROT|nr:response regulator [Arboricoccus pini]SNB69796.1 Signal transduction histidine kinase [Arboricoccus pini]